MTIVGGNLEKKEIGLQIGVSGTYENTEIDKSTGYLRLAQVDVDGSGNPIYAEEGSWTSDVIDLGDIFQDFEKIFTTNTNNGASSFAILTRVSNNGREWSDWTAIAEDGTIQSDTKQYIQVRIDLFAGFVTDVFIISNSDFEVNEFVEEKELKQGRYIVPTLTSNTSSQEGFAFASSQFSTNYPAWKAFDKVDTSEGYVAIGGTKTGFLGFCFKNKITVTKYKVRSMAGSYLNSMPKNWVLQGSNDTTDGINGTWEVLDTQTNQTWTTLNTDKIYALSNKTRFHAYRINFSDNNGHSYTGIGELDFYVDGTTSLQLKREYQHNITLDSTWSDTGSLHRKKITRDEWVRIDNINVK
ncbi:hypothetical protein [Lysinibacillus sphaericus]|uniref:Uncharacterized protein n=1 Tax=Lysinibacillus sphaericus OT4b.31 TaxID=1285586 RepID=R7ZFC1_LYSSH|nr:hypothetical protein [Lysinibacillus sphaericus]EON72830.1 hypothetical protein H131_08983 [Lysinibacillus sphaericus OT4b.31]